MSNTELAKPLLRWAGSKRRIIPQIKSLSPKSSFRYLEAFAGSACLMFALQPKQSLINDVNSELIRMYRTVRDYPEEVFSLLSKMPIEKDLYYLVRERIGIQENDQNFSADFIYLNRNCFNGLYRTNKAGKFNVPYSGYKTPKILNLKDFMVTATALSNVNFSDEDFETFVLSNVTAGDFVYLDPPYAVSNKRIFKQYGPHEFGLDDLERLARLLNTIDDSGAQFVLSYADCKEARSMFNEWEMRRLIVNRNMAGFSKHRRRSAELLFSNAG